ncbi:MAG: sirohydrochlorin cobaltochelatase [Bacillota bacterium]|nr:sirohydrochlorin cobaltochelatase [Bacillota bacterium]
MKNLRKFIVVAMAFVLAMGMMLMATGCGGSGEEEQAASDPVADCNAAIEAIQVQEWTEDTDAQCQAAKDAYDALTDEQKEQLDDPDYFGLDTGDASKDDPLNGDEIGENELLVVSFGTSFNDSRATDIGGVEKALAEAYPDWSVRRAFTAQIIINHVQARDGEKIDNIQQALDRAVANEVKNLVIQPTHLMHGAEYDELTDAVDGMKDNFESVEIAEPLLGEVGADASEVNADKEAVAKAVVAAAVEASDFDSLDAMAADGTALVLMGHGTGHEANVTYDQMQTQMKNLGYDNVFVGTVEGNPPDTALPEVKKALEKAGYSKVILRPMMVVAGDHANNDMAGDWADALINGGEFEVEGADAPVDLGEGLGKDNVSSQIEGMGRVADIQKVYVDHTAAAMQ